MTRWFLYRLSPALGLVLALIGAGVFLSTEAGLRWMWARIGPGLAPVLSIERVSGRIFDRIQVENLRLETPAATIHLRQGWLSWKPSALWNATLRINELVLLSPHIQIQPASDSDPGDTESFNWPKLPRISLQGMKVFDLRWGEGETPAQQITKLFLNGRSAGELVELRVERLDWPGVVLASAELDGRIQSAALSLTRLQLTQLDGPGRIQGNAACLWPIADCRLSLDWTELGWPLTQPSWRSARGQIRANGDTQGYAANLWAEVVGSQLPRQLVQLELAGNLVGLQSFRAELTGESGDLAAQGSVQWQEQLQVHAQLKGHGLNPEFWVPQWPADLGLRTSVDLIAGDTVQITISNLDAQGTIRDKQLALSGNGSWRPDNIAFDNGVLVWGRNRIAGHGRIAAQRIQAKLEVKAPNLAAFWPGLDGDLRGTLQLGGSLQQPSVVGKLSAANFGFHELRAASVDLEGNANWQAGGSVDIAAQLTELRSGENLVENVELIAFGHPDSLKVSVAAAAEQGLLDAALSLSWDFHTQTARGQLESASVRPQALGRWELAQRVGFSAAEELVQLERACWHTGAAKACFEFQWAAAKVSAAAEIHDLPLDYFSYFLPPEMEVLGSANAQLEIPPSPSSQLSLNALVQTSAVEIRRGDEDQLDGFLKLGPGVASVSAIQGRWKLGADVPIQSGGGLRMDATLNPQGQQLALDGQLDLTVDDLSFVPALSAEVVSATGRLQGQFKGSGTWEAPRIAGKLALEEGRLSLDRPNITLESLRATLDARGGSSLAVAIYTESAGGALEVSGHLDWRGGDLSVEALLTGDRFQVANSKEVQARISPNLRLLIRDREIKVRGDIDIPEALIQPTSLESSGAVGSSPDVVLVNAPPNRERAYRIDSRVNLKLGSDVRFDGFGLKTNIEGQMRVSQKPGQLATANGELRFDAGRYRAYGQDLTVERGRLLFNEGLVTDPGIDLRAFRRPQAGVLVGVQVRGSLRQPEFSLYSEPGMAETDQLSYLVLGRAARAESDQDEAVLNNAALALGLKGGDYLAKRFKDRLGLDEVQIGAQPGEAADQAALVLGKYLTPDIYVSYGIGLFDPISTFRLRYRLSRRWSLETESGVESGGDLYYTVER